MTEEPRESSFDELAKGLASGTLSRRKALRLMGAALVGGVFASVPGGAFAARPVPCAPGVERCGRNCCPNADFICAQGKCACPTGTTRIGNTCCQNEQVCGSSCGCQTGQGCCNSVCTDLSTTTNCGACGRTCSPIQSCVGGQCQCSNTCPAGDMVANPTTCQCECPNPNQEQIVPACAVDASDNPTQCVCCNITQLESPCCEHDPLTGRPTNCRCCNNAANELCHPDGHCCVPDPDTGVCV
jgi:hypothetical protein